MAERGIGFGAIVKCDHDLDTTFEAIPNVRSITPYPIESESVDTTVIDDAVKDSAQSKQVDYGNIAFTFLWDSSDAEHAKLVTLVESGAKVDWQISFPFATPDVKEFTGYVVSITGGDLTAAAPIERTCTVKVTTKPT